MNSFEALELSNGLNKALKKIYFKYPTPIQAQAIPLALQGMDILGSAQTGTGKTAAFSIPLIESLLTSDKSIGLVLTPTRELAKQVMDVISSLLSDLNHINTSCLIGGEQITRQLKQLKKKPRIIVGTPGRVNDHLDRKSLKLDDTKFLVLDETDRMLDMGFGVQIDRILKFIPKSNSTAKIQFYSLIASIIGAIILLVMTLDNIVIKSYNDLLMLVSIGILGGSAGILFIYAYRLIEASKLAVFEYLAIPSSFFLGWFFFDEAPIDQLFPGVFGIILAGMIIIWRDKKKKKTFKISKKVY